MNSRGSNIGIIPAVLIGMLLIIAPIARADELLAHGTDEMYWVARYVVPTADAPDRQPLTSIRGRSTGTTANWTDVARLESRVTSMANRGRELAVLLDSGSWMLLWPGGSAMGARPADGARLLALTSGDGAIFAIAAGGRPAPATAPATQPETPESPPAGELSLYRLDRGRWTRLTTLPADIVSADVPRLSTAIADGNPIISVLDSEHVRSWRYDGGQWLTIESLDVPGAGHIKLLANEHGTLLWVAPAAGEAAGALYGLMDRRWSAPTALADAAELEPDSPRTVALASGNVRLLFIRDNRVFEQTFDRAGRSLAEAAALPSVPLSPDTMPSRILTLTAAAMLMVVVLSSLRRGGGAAPATAATAAGLAPAPLSLRFFAGLIDLLPFAVPCWIVFSRVDPGEAADQLVATVTIPVYLALAAYLLYTWICESIFGRTVGKMFFGLRVVLLDGAAPGRGAMFLRNALRLVDVAMVGIPLILVILSPLHQRVGDIAGRTFVVKGPPVRAPDEPPQPEDRE